jgi:hypothetical protein
MKKFISIVATAVALAAAVWVCLRTNLLFEDMRTYGQWAQRYEEIEAGSYEPPAITSYEDHEALRNDFVSLLEKQQEDFFQKLMHRSHLDSDGPIAWRDGAILHMNDLAPYGGAPSGSTAAAWKEGISEYWASKWTNAYSESQRIQLAFVAINFDEMDIQDALGDSHRIDLKGMRPEGFK